MADEDNTAHIRDEHLGFMKNLQAVRDSLSGEIDYYYDRVPESEEEDSRQRGEIRERLSRIRQRLESLSGQL